MNASLVLFSINSLRALLAIIAQPRCELCGTPAEAQGLFAEMKTATCLPHVIKYTERAKMCVRARAVTSRGALSLMKPSSERPDLPRLR